MRLRSGLLAAIAAFTLLVDPVRAHVDYVTPGPGEALDALEFALRALSDPLTAGLLFVGGLSVTAGVGWWVTARPEIPDLTVLGETLSGYRDLVPWMLRLALGLPLVGAGFNGYFFSPIVAAPGLRVPLVAIGFLLLFGLATRAVAAAGLVLYFLGLPGTPELLLAMEYVPGFLAILLLGGGRPSADHMLGRVAGTEGTYYHRVDPFHGLARRLDDRLDPVAAYAPTVIRTGLGVTFVYLGVIEKLLNPGRALLVVEKYDLTAVVPVPAEAWVLGAGLTEVAVGLALVLGLLTRGTAAVAFLVLTTTLFGLPDDPVLAHVTLFGLTSAVFTLGNGPLALDSYRRASDDPDDSATLNFSSDNSGGTT